MANQPPCDVAMEACYSSHYRARTFEAMGHRVKLIPAQHFRDWRRQCYSDLQRDSQRESVQKRSEFAVWLGLTPKTASSGQTFKSGDITKRGNGYLRKQLVHGARSALTRCRSKTDNSSN